MGLIKIHFLRRERNKKDREEETGKRSSSPIEMGNRSMPIANCHKKIAGPIKVNRRCQRWFRNSGKGAERWKAERRGERDTVWAGGHFYLATGKIRYQLATRLLKDFVFYDDKPTFYFLVYLKTLLQVNVKLFNRMFNY